MTTHRRWLLAARSALVLLLLGNPLIQSTQASDLDSIQWKLAAIDVFGNRNVGVEIIVQISPWQVGAFVKAKDRPARDQWCQALKTKFDFASTHCEMILLPPDHAYLSVDVVEKGEECREAYAASRSQPSVQLEPELGQALERLQRRQQSLFSKGAPIEEKVDPSGWLDYTEPTLHQEVLRLNNVVPAYRAHLLQVAGYGGDAAQRAAAATLLSWAGEPAATAAQVYQWLDDPDEEVRNNISRFLMNFSPRIASTDVKARVVDALIKQLDRPSMADRNKSLYALSRLVDQSAELAGIVERSGCRRIKHIAAVSKMPNVGGRAQFLLTKLKCS